MKKISEINRHQFPEYLNVALSLACGPGRGESDTAIVDLNLIIDKLNEVIRRINGGSESEEEVHYNQDTSKYPYNTGYITEAIQPLAWKNKTCYLIGGGPSLKDFDFSLIEEEWTIGVNKAFVQFPTTINYAMDIRFYNMLTQPQTKEARELHNRWLQYEGITVSLKRNNKQKFQKPVYYVNQLDGRFTELTRTKKEKELLTKVNEDTLVAVSPDVPLSLDLDEGILGGNNSGFGALMLAIALGATRIGLLGYDFKVQGTGNNIQTHYHGGYSFTNKRKYATKVIKFMEPFVKYAQTIKDMGVEVVNLNPDSALNCFEKMNIEDFMAEQITTGIYEILDGQIIY